MENIFPIESFATPMILSIIKEKIGWLVCIKRCQHKSMAVVRDCSIATGYWSSSIGNGSGSLFFSWPISWPLSFSSSALWYFSTSSFWSFSLFSPFVLQMLRPSWTNSPIQVSLHRRQERHLIGRYHWKFLSCLYTILLISDYDEWT